MLSVPKRLTSSGPRQSSRFASSNSVNEPVVGAVDQRVDATEAFDRRVDKALTCRSVGDIGGQREHVAALGFDLGDDSGELGLAATTDSDARAFAGEGVRKLLAEARADTGDDGNLVL
jgi:hypothetical protein